MADVVAGHANIQMTANEAIEALWAYSRDAHAHEIVGAEKIDEYFDEKYQVPRALAAIAVHLGEATGEEPAEPEDEVFGFEDKIQAGRYKGRSLLKVTSSLGPTGSSSAVTLRPPVVSGFLDPRIGLEVDAREPDSTSKKIAVYGSYRIDLEGNAVYRSDNSGYDVASELPSTAYRNHLDLAFVEISETVCRHVACYAQLHKHNSFF